MNVHQEIRTLNTATGLIESMVNYGICCLPEDKTEVAKTVLPKNYIAKKYFFILLLELFSTVNKEMIPGKNKGDSLVDILQKISTDPLLNNDKKMTESLNKATTEILEWLDTEFNYDIYSANISKEITITLSRREALYLIGNRCKHTLTRSNGILRKLVNIYKKTGLKIGPATEILLLEDIDNWLFDDFGGYHFTKLCELCSNLYHSINNYVGNEVRSRMIRKNDMMYSYKVPESLTRDDEIFEFYELLNRFRSPWIHKIRTWEHLLEKY